MDLTLAYSLGPVTLSMADLYWTGHADDRYFVFDSRSPHRIEVGASWVVSEKVPVTLSWYTVLFGAADVNDKGERAYASYFEAACPFTVKTVDHEGRRGHGPLERRRDLPHPETADSACRTSSSMPENRGRSKGRIRCRSAFSPT